MIAQLVERWTVEGDHIYPSVTGSNPVREIFFPFFLSARQSTGTGIVPCIDCDGIVPVLPVHKSLSLLVLAKKNSIFGF